MKKSLNIALDFDDTYTSDPDFWRKFIKLAHKHDHVIYICTMRHDYGQEKDDVEEEIDGLVPIIYCSRRWKRKVCEEMGIKIDIFIDDLPEGVGNQKDLEIYEYTTGKLLHIWDWLGGKNV